MAPLTDPTKGPSINKDFTKFWIKFTPPLTKFELGQVKTVMQIVDFKHLNA